MFSVDEIVDLAIRIETNGEAAYRKAAQACKDPRLAAMLLRLAEEEARHAVWFKDMRGQGKGPAGVTGELDAMGRDLLLQIFGDQAFSLDKEALLRQEGFEGLLAMVMEFEDDTILFYEMLQSLSEDPGVLACLGRILQEERQHTEGLGAVVLGSGKPIREIRERLREPHTRRSL